jgi:signal transduction histidine kinase
VRLVDDLLDVSRMAENKISLDKKLVDLLDVFRAAVESTRPILEHEGHTLVVNPLTAPAFVLGDASRLTQVVINLLGNAAKYTPRGGRVELFGAVDAAARKVTFGVRDNGIGMDHQLLPRVFDLFVQGSEVAGRSSGGLGIGLNLARRLVELHGGSISAHSDGENRGSEFRVELPLAPENAAHR